MPCWTRHLVLAGAVLVGSVVAGCASPGPRVEDVSRRSLRDPYQVRCVGVTLDAGEKAARPGPFVMLSATPDTPALIEMKHHGLRGVARRQTTLARGRTYGAVSLEIRDDKGGLVASTFGPIPLSPDAPIVLSSVDGAARLSVLCGMADAVAE